MLDLSGEGIKIHVPNKTASNFPKAEKAEKKTMKIPMNEQPVDLNTQELIHFPFLISII